MDDAASSTHKSYVNTPTFASYRIYPFLLTRVNALAYIDVRHREYVLSGKRVILYISQQFRDKRVEIHELFKLLLFLNNSSVAERSGQKKIEVVYFRGNKLNWSVRYGPQEVPDYLLFAS